MYASINERLTIVWNCFIILPRLGQRKAKKSFSHIRCLNVMLCYAQHVACDLQVQLAFLWGVTVSCVCAHVNTYYHLVQKLLSYTLLSEYVQTTTKQYSQYGSDVQSVPLATKPSISLIILILSACKWWPLPTHVMMSSHFLHNEVRPLKISIQYPHYW
jgi:hypothetical protein